MSLRKSIVTTVSVTLTTLVTLLFVVTKNNLLENYTELERAELKEDINRVENAIEAHGDALYLLTRDWASWDATYEFIRTHSSEYVETNLGGDTFSDAELRAILFFDADGHLVYGGWLPPGDDEPGDVPPWLLKSLADKQLLMATPESSTRGILAVGEETLLVASRPILTSDNEGPARGTLILARDFETKVMSDVIRTTSMDIATKRLDRPATGTDFAFAETMFASSPASDEQKVVFEVIDDDTIAGYSRLVDLSGNPAFILRVETPRTILERARSGLAYLLVSMVVVGVVLLLLVIYMLDRLVLLPLSRLNRHVTHVADSGDLSLLYRPPGDTELAQLADSIRSMLDEIRTGRTALEQANEKLERRVDERTAALVQARDDAIEALKVKDQILANVSHDSRTPLNTIMLRAELMKSGRYGPLTDDQAQALDSIVASVNQLTLFTTNLLYEAQSAGGRVDLHSEPVELDAELDRIVNIMKPLAERKNIGLFVYPAESGPVSMIVNRQALHQVVSNLVDNAVKFTDQGRVDIRVTTPDDSSIAISVSDTGRGISPDLRHRIFEPFWQADGSVTREANRGVGLGLSIVRLLVEHLGGSTSIDDREDNGTVFTVVLPRDAGSSPG